MYCHACGIALRDGARFCPGCGTPVAIGAPREGSTSVRSSTPPIVQETQSPAASQVHVPPLPVAGTPVGARRIPMALPGLFVRDRAVLELVCTLIIASFLIGLALAPGFIVTPTLGRLASARASLSLAGLLILLFTGSGAQGPTMASVSCSVLIAIAIIGAIAAWISTGLCTAAGRHERPAHALAVTLTTLSFIALLVTQSLWQVVCPWLCRGQPFGIGHLSLDLVDSPSFPLTAPLLCAAICTMAVEAITRKRAMAQEGSQSPGHEACAQSALCALGLALCVSLLCGVPVLAQLSGESSLSLTELALITYTCASGWVPGVIGAVIVVTLLALTLAIGAMQASRIAQGRAGRAGMVVTCIFATLFALSGVMYVYLANSPGIAPSFSPLPFGPSIAMWILLVAVIVLPVVTTVWHCRSIGAYAHNHLGDGGRQ